MANPPYVPTAVYKVKTMVELADPKKGERMVDLGSGDGRIPIAFAKQGIHAVGFETNEELVKTSREKAKEEGFSDSVTIHHSDFWEADISSFDIIVVFGMQTIMKRLEYKIRHEAKKDARVLSNVFRFHHLKLLQTKDDVSLYLVR